MPGAVAGAPGAYPQRTDLQAGTQPVRAAPGQQYGQGAQQERAQQAVPLPDFAAPTTRPNEPITAGLPTGPGPGPVEAGLPQGAAPTSSVADQLRAIYSVYPTEDLKDLIDSLAEH